MFLYFVSSVLDLTSNLQLPTTTRLPSLSAAAVTQVHSGVNPGEQHYSHAATQFVRQDLSFSRLATSHEPAVVEVVADRKFAVRGSSLPFVPFLLIDVPQRPERVVYRIILHCNCYGRNFNSYTNLGVMLERLWGRSKSSSKRVAITMDCKTPRECIATIKCSIAKTSETMVDIAYILWVLVRYIW